MRVVLVKLVKYVFAHVYDTRAISAVSHFPTTSRRRKFSAFERVCTLSMRTFPAVFVAGKLGSQ